jgi:protein TonB
MSSLAARVGLCAAISLALHLAVGRALASLPLHEAESAHAKLELDVVPAPPPPPPPAPPVEQQPIQPAPVDHPAPPTPRETPPKVMPAPVPGPPATPGPPSPQPGVPTPEPVFGADIDSSSTGTMAVTPGNTLAPAGTGGTGASQPTGPVGPPPIAPAYEVTRMPIPLGRCTGRYTDEARKAAVEGTVTLDLVVDPDGTTRDVTVVSGLPHGLSDAAVAALRACRFTPGERKGEPVAVRVNDFKIIFVLSGQ